MDFSAVCRTCIKTYNNIGLNPIFLSKDTHERFSSAFYSCTGVQVKLNDGLPQNMCSACMNQFNNTLKFRKQCKQAETQLLKIKTELEVKNMEKQPLLKKLLTNVKKSTSINFSNVTRFKPEAEINSIKNEAFEIDFEEDKPLKYLVHKHNISVLNSNDLKRNDDDEINTEEISETDFLNEEMVSYKNETNLKSEANLPQNSGESKYDIYSRRLLEKSEDPTLFENRTAVLERFSESNATKNSDIPYIVTDTTTQKTTRVVCKLCQKELSIRSIDSHMMRRHPGADERKVKCELCDKYVMRDKLNRHKVMMHGRVGVNCGYCKSEFKSKESLVDHVATCTAKNRKRKVNDSGRTLAECDICKMTMQRASLNKHKAVKHAGLRPVCEHCGKSFGNKFRLNEHYRAKHGYEKFKCSYSYCDFRSAGIMAMRNHERRHRGEKPFVCETCGAKFHAAYLLMQHKHSHKTEKLVKCDLCPASFKANNNLHMHKLTCHSKSYYSCTLCARSYKCRYYAVKHVRLAHSVSDAPEVIKLMTQ